MLEGNEVLGRVVGSDPADAVAEGHIHDPIEAYYDKSWQLKDIELVK